ncbi:MAG TPA: hypothetical protein VFM46_04450 [Pseudomonadales bacterium]|nr:hypothetical protein [Pseudomonadales bacterium]
MGPLKNTRHERFALGLAEGLCACESYEAAGYKANRGNACRLKANESIQSRVLELQQAAAKDTKVTVESLIAELELARTKATDLNQFSAAVRATGEKIKLSGLATTKLEISEPSPFTDDMSIPEILRTVAEERGARAAWYLGMAYGIKPEECGIYWSNDRLLAGNNGETQQTEGNKAIMREGGKTSEIRGAPAVSADFGKPVSQRAIEERKPVVSGRRREL